MLLRRLVSLPLLLAAGICRAQPATPYAPAANEQTAASKAGPLAACGDEKQNFEVSRGEVKDQTDPPPDGEALLYIVEIFNLKDKGRFNRPTLKQGLDGQWIGATQGFSYVSAAVDPGPHHLCTQWQSHFDKLSQQVSLNDFAAEAGKRYYFRAQINVVGEADILSVDLDHVSDDEGRFLVSEAAHSVSKPKH